MLLAEMRKSANWEWRKSRASIELKDDTVTDLPDLKRNTGADSEKIP